MGIAIDCTFISAGGTVHAARVEFSLAPWGELGAHVRLKLEIPDATMALEQDTERAFLRPLAAGLRQLIGVEDKGFVPPPDWYAEELAETGELALANWDSIVFLVFRAADDGSGTVVMSGYLPSHIMEPGTQYTVDTTLQTVLRGWMFVTAFQGLRLTKEDVARLADAIEEFDRKYPPPKREG